MAVPEMVGVMTMSTVVQPMALIGTPTLVNIRAMLVPLDLRAVTIPMMTMVKMTAITVMDVARRITQGGGEKSETGTQGDVKRSSIRSQSLPSRSLRPATKPGIIP